jgi:hypothetical protein
MDEHIISINQQKEKAIQFQVSIEGTDAEDATVRLVVDLNNGTLLSIVCIKLEGGEYEARIPVLSHIERTAYPCYIEVITNGYYFKAMKGVLNVTGSATITAQPTVTQPKKSEEDKGDDHKEEKTKEESLSFFKTKPTSPALGVSGVKELAEKAVANEKKAKKVSEIVKPEPEKEPVKLEESAPIIPPVVTIDGGVVEHSARDVNDSKVRQVLESLGITTTPKRKPPKLKVKR